LALRVGSVGLKREASLVPYQDWAKPSGLTRTSVGT